MISITTGKKSLCLSASEPDSKGRWIMQDMRWILLISFSMLRCTSGLPGWLRGQHSKATAVDFHSISCKLKYSCSTSWDLYIIPHHQSYRENPSVWFNLNRFIFFGGGGDKTKPNKTHLQFYMGCHLIILKLTDSHRIFFVVVVVLFLETWCSLMAPAM